jgi:hypothetical protein
VAKKRRRKSAWLKSLLLFILTPLVIWFFAFVVWLNWDAIVKLINRETDKTKPSARAVTKADKADSPSNEKILDEDRKKLDEILKKRP